MRTRSRTGAVAALLLAASMFPVQATFHLIKIVEIFPGTAASPNAQYIVIQMYASGQEFVSGHAITVYNGAGSLTATFTFTHDVANGMNQAKILIATSQAASFFGISPDLTMSPAVLSAGGKACWAGTLDCVAWGSYSGSTTGVGTPFNVAGGLVSGRAAIRRLNIAGSTTVLEAGDDTNNCANDFVSGLPAPRNNAGVLGKVPSATCGNGVLEGLEQCDDHNVVNGDGCSSTCTIQARRVVGDYNGDGKSDAFWRNTSTGANSIWKSADSATKQATTAVTDLNWQIVGRGDFDGDGKSDIFWRNTGTGANSIWKSANSATKQAVTAVTGLSWHVVGIGDFGGDGKSDVLWRDASTGSNSIWKSANSATKQTVTAVTGLSWHVVGIGDFDGDGKSDVLWRDTSTGSNSIWKSANSATKQAMTAVTGLNWHIVGVGDFGGDGKSDVFWRDTSTGSNSIWKSANSATKQTVTAVTGLSWHVVGIGDFGGDGKSDVFWRDTSTGSNSIWKSANSATKQAVTGITDQAWTMVPYEGQAL